MALKCVTLRDAAVGSEAEILIDFGFNCFRFQAVRDGRPVEVLWSHPRFTEGGESPSGSGLPILFPFPGRIRGTELLWKGHKYTLQEGDGRGNAIHGFVHGRRWRIVSQTANRLVGVFQASVDHPDLLQCWPADFRITADYLLEGNCLTTRFTIENPDEEELPCGLGLHPYFRLPEDSGQAAACRVRLPVSTAWELVEMNATGRQTPIEEATRYQEGVPFGQLTLDNVFSGLRFDGSLCTASIDDPAAGGGSTVVSFDRAFRECVAYTPPHREAICIEPYTCVPDAFRLAREGIDAGLRVLAPGESFEAVMMIVVQ